MAGMTISEAAEAWGVDRSTVKRWIGKGRVEASKDNAGIWRIEPGQQPPPSLEQHQGRPRTAPGSPQETTPGADQVQAEFIKLREALAEAKIALAHVERDRDLSRREVELLRERLADSQAERDRLHALVREALNRPSLFERLLRAIRGAKASTKEGG